MPAQKQPASQTFSTDVDTRKSRRSPKTVGMDTRLTASSASRRPNDSLSSLQQLCTLPWW
eukprot:2360387-Prymnesium_polylepis.1